MSYAHSLIAILLMWISH